MPTLASTTSRRTPLQNFVKRWSLVSTHSGEDSGGPPSSPPADDAKHKRLGSAKRLFSLPLFGKGHHPPGGVSQDSIDRAKLPPSKDDMDPPTSRHPYEYRSEHGSDLVATSVPPLVLMNVDAIRAQAYAMNPTPPSFSSHPVPVPVPVPVPIPATKPYTPTTPADYTNDPLYHDLMATMDSLTRDSLRTPPPPAAATFAREDLASSRTGASLTASASSDSLSASSTSGASLSMSSARQQHQGSTSQQQTHPVRSPSATTPTTSSAVTSIINVSGIAMGRTASTGAIGAAARMLSYDHHVFSGASGSGGPVGGGAAPTTPGPPAAVGMARTASAGPTVLSPRVGRTRTVPAPLELKAARRGTPSPSPSPSPEPEPVVERKVSQTTVTSSATTVAVGGGGGKRTPSPTPTPTGNGPAVKFAKEADVIEVVSWPPSPPPSRGAMSPAPSAWTQQQRSMAAAAAAGPAPAAAAAAAALALASVLGERSPGSPQTSRGQQRSASITSSPSPSPSTSASASALGLSPQLPTPNARPARILQQPVRRTVSSTSLATLGSGALSASNSVSSAAGSPVSPSLPVLGTQLHHSASSSSSLAPSTSSFFVPTSHEASSQRERRPPSISSVSSIGTTGSVTVSPRGPRPFEHGLQPSKRTSAVRSTSSNRRPGSMTPPSPLTVATGVGERGSASPLASPYGQPPQLQYVAAGAGVAANAPRMQQLMVSMAMSGQQYGAFANNGAAPQAVAAAYAYTAAAQQMAAMAAGSQGSGHKTGGTLLTSPLASSSASIRSTGSTGSRRSAKAASIGSVGSSSSSTLVPPSVVAHAPMMVRRSMPGPPSSREAAMAGVHGSVMMVGGGVPHPHAHAHPHGIMKGRSKPSSPLATGTPLVAAAVDSRGVIVSGGDERRA
ncbi:hypothetical protein HDU96_000732 [Phlyctochytrium bullatum]|nr:hypothetical protein HDU96_000732 [Phlyctochytrium bullatum]